MQILSLLDFLLGCMRDPAGVSEEVKLPGLGPATAPDVAMPPSSPKLKPFDPFLAGVQDVRPGGRCGEHSNQKHRCPMSQIVNHLSILAMVQSICSFYGRQL